MIIDHKRVASAWPMIFSLSLALVLLVIVLSLFFGAAPITPVEVLRFFVGQAQAQSELIISELRLPRALLAAAIGALMACSGALAQGLFRNPLADPSLIGVSAGAAVGASIVIVFFNSLEWQMLGLSLVSIGAFIGGVVAVLFVYRIATTPLGTSVATMLLAGIAVNFIAGGLANIFEFMADSALLRRLSLWRMGGLDMADHTRVTIAFIACAGFFAVVPRFFTVLNTLLLGESETKHLGFDTDQVKRKLIFLIAAGVGVSVALSGAIAFIGLVVPHIVRMLIGPNHRYLIPLCACLGAVLLTAADILARTLIAPNEIPVGLVTTFIGAPVFISLLRKRHHYGMQ